MSELDKYSWRGPIHSFKEHVFNYIISESGEIIEDENPFVYIDPGPRGGPINRFAKECEELLAQDIDMSNYKKVVSSCGTGTNDCVACFFRSLAFYRLSNYENAYRDADNVDRLSVIDNLFFLQGQCYKNRTFYSLAIACFEIANRREKSTIRFLEIGWIRNKLLDFNSAIKCFEEAITIAPNDFRGYDGLSEALWALGEQEAAINNLITCIRKNRYLAVAYSKLAHYYYKLNNNNEEAICLLRIALSREPSNPEFFLALANYYCSWNSIKGLSSEFTKQFAIDDTVIRYCNRQAFEEKVRIANGFYSSAFVELFPIAFKEDISLLDDHINVSIFVGNQDHLFDILRTHTLFFADVTSFSDKVSDCPLLHSNSQSQLAKNISKDNIRVRCCSILHKKEDICQSLSMWDRYANGHSGVCYTLKIPKTWLLRNAVYANRILYSPEEIMLNAESPERIIRDGLFIKYSGYEDEHEFRMIAFGKFDGMKGIKLNFHGGNSEDSIKIETVYAGTHISEENKKAMMDLVLKNYPVVAYQVKQSAAGKLDTERIWR
jgi:hypothetical protein